jgi:hypothetical protein
MQIAGHRADGAIAIERLQFRRRVDFESNASAMA